MSAPFLAIATKSFKGVVRGAKVEGMKNPAFTKTRKVAHVGMFEEVEALTTKTTYREVENFAEFDGPTCVDACETFLSLVVKGAARSCGRCVADGRSAPVKLWKKLDSVERKNITLPESFTQPKDDSVIQAERHPILPGSWEVAP